MSFLIKLQEQNQHNRSIRIRQWIMFIVLAALVMLACTKRNNMVPVGYLVSVTTDSGDIEANLNVHTLASGGHTLMGAGAGSQEKLSRNLHIIPANNKSSDKLTAKLNAIPGVRQVSIVPISDPIKTSELSDIRKLYLDYNYDASGVSGDQLSLCLNTHLNGEYTYCLIPDLGLNENGLSQLRFRLTQDVIDEDKKDTSTKIVSRKKRIEGDMEIHEVEIKKVMYVTPPPPSPLLNLSKMSDAHIKQGYLKNDRELKKEDIDIKRTPEEIIITEKYNGGMVTVRYPINNNK